VTSTKSGAAELVAGHDAGFICDSRDAAALATHLRALQDPALRARQGDNARRAVLPLTPESMTLALVLLYRALLEASVARRLAAKAARAGPPAAAEVPAAPDAAVAPPPAAAEPPATSRPPASPAPPAAGDGPR
jgi:hypothetical protein